MKLTTRLLSFSALTILMLNSVAPFLVEYIQVTSGTLNIQVCTDNGYKTVTIKTKNPKKTSNESQIPTHYKCPLCYITTRGLVYYVPDSIAFEITQQLAIKESELIETLIESVKLISSFNIKKGRAPPTV